MKLVIFGLTLSSSWANGHATLWRGLCRALRDQGHRVTFFERDVAYYARHRDLTAVGGVTLHLYRGWSEIIDTARRELADADVGLVTSYCPDAIGAADLVLSAPVSVAGFYDLDTPVTLERLATGEPVEYIGPAGLSAFDLVLSYTGGGALDALRTQLGARRVAALYGSVDPRAHAPAPPSAPYRSDASYLGTYSADRQRALATLFLEPARCLPERRFLLGGSQYPDDLPWPANLRRLEHVAPPEHPGFYCSSPVTVSVTRQAMARLGYCPSGRLFEAAACGTPVLSDWWEGLDQFFEPEREIFVCTSTDEAIEVLSRSPADLARVGRAARERALAEHTAEARARQLVTLLEASG